MTKNTSEIEDNSPFCLSSTISYEKWRSIKIKHAKKFQTIKIIKIADLANPNANEIATVKDSINKTNMAIYQTKAKNDQQIVSQDIREFANSFDLNIAEDHRSASNNGVVALTPSNAPSQKNYIPYSHKKLNWHTDGYYNAPDEQIRSMVLHCFEPANSGGVNQLLDNDIAYIRVRDHNPLFIKALMHPKVLIIPENLDENGKLRPKSIGPVFSTDKSGKNLYMRYSARTKYIEWKNDEITKQAVSYLQSVLENNDEFMHQIKLKAGQGIICNNSLHNRTGFNSNASESSSRVMFRVRFFNEITGENNGKAK